METINLNLIPSGTNPVVHCSQYDEGRVFRFNLFDGSNVFTLDGTETIECGIKKPDGNIVTVAVTNTSDSYIDIVTTEQMCACGGNSFGTIKISKGDDNIYTLNFTLYCEPSPYENGIQSDSAIHNLNTMVDEMVAEDVAEQYDSANVIFDNVPTSGHGTPYTVTSEGIKTAIDNAFDYDNTASGSLVHITDGADNIPVKSLASEIVAVESGSGTKSPTNPYTISGFDNGIITRCGKNLYNTNNQTTTSINTYCPMYLPTNTDITFSTNIVQTGLYAQYYDNGNWVAITQKYNTRTLTFNTGNHNYIRLMTYNEGTQATEFQAEFGTTETTYEPYIDNTYTFTFGQTVYGGHFDNKGNLVVTHGIKTFTGASSESWSEYPSYNGFYIAITDMNIGTRQDGWANRFVTTFDSSHTSNSCWFGVNSNRLFILECSGTTGATVADLKTWLANNNLTVKYPLANPITLSITSQDIPTLLGENNIFSNCGDVEVEYYTSKANDILDFIDSEIGKKNGTNILIEGNSPDSIKTYIDNGLSGKADTSDTYTENEVDTLLSGKADSNSVYSKAEVDTALSGKLDITAIKILTGTGTTDASGVITSTALGIAQLDYNHHLILGVQSSNDGCVVNVGQYNTNFYYVCVNASNMSVPMANTSVTITVIYMDR